MLVHIQLKGCFAVPTDVSGKRVPGYPTLHTGSREYQVIDDLTQPPEFVNQRRITAAARSRPLLFNGDDLVDRNLCERARAFHSSLATESLQPLVRSYVHLISLIIPVGSLIDLLKLR